MPPKKRPLRDDDSSDEDIDVEQVLQTKQELDKIRKDRDKKRAQLQKDFEKKVSELRTRIRQTLADHTRQLGGMNQEQVGRLLQAIDTRDSIIGRIQKRLEEARTKGASLGEHLGSAYEHRVKKVQSLATPAQPDQGQALQRKKAKTGSSS